MNFSPQDQASADRSQNLNTGVEAMLKKELERRIVEARSKLPISYRESGWLSTNELTELLEAFSNLHRYYLTHEDDQETQHIYFEVLNVYLDVSRSLHSLLERKKNIDQQEEEIQDALSAFEYVIDGMISCGYAQINNPRRLPGQ
jgi:hypothetical protein